MEQIDWTVRYAARDDLARVNELRAMVSALHAAGRPIFSAPASARWPRRPHRRWTRRRKTSWSPAPGRRCGFALVQYVDRPESAYQHARRIYHIEEFGVTPLIAAAVRRP